MNIDTLRTSKVVKVSKKRMEVRPLSYKRKTVFLMKDFIEAVEQEYSTISLMARFNINQSRVMTFRNCYFDALIEEPHHYEPENNTDLIFGFGGKFEDFISYV